MGRCGEDLGEPRLEFDLWYSLKRGEIWCRNFRFIEIDKEVNGMYIRYDMVGAVCITKI